MFGSDFYDVIKKVEKSYCGFDIYKDGSTKDKFIFSCLILLYIGVSVFLFWGNVLSGKLYWEIVSLVIFLVCMIVFIKFQTYIRRRETIMYQKKQSLLDEFRIGFEERLSKNNIKPPLFPIITEYYENEINRNQIYKYKEIYNYFVVVLIPIFISFITSKNAFYALLFGIIGLMIISPIYLCISIVVDRNINKYKMIVYYLRLIAIIDKYKFSQNL